MPESGTSGSVGAAGEQSPVATRPSVSYKRLIIFCRIFCRKVRKVLILLASPSTF